MQGPTRLSITPVAAAVTAALYPGFAALAQDNANSEYALEEIIVTATKRSVSLQDIPATIQAITQESLAAMGAKGMEDYARFVPSVNVVTYGAGSSTVVFRGAITGAGYIGQSTSSVYLDEISITQTGAQPSIRAVDIERVEALSGPQGTLYGSDAQAGTMRILTNQPVMNTFEAIFDGEVRGGSDSDSSYRGSLVFNLPLVEDKLALRVVGYKDRDGGFIDNVLGNTANWHGLNGVNVAPAGFGSLDNSAVVEKNWNEADIYGGRVHLRWEMNENWATTLSYQHQTADSGAGNHYDPFVGDLQTVRFHDEYRNESFDMASLKIEADLGFAQMVAAASYYDREVNGLDDITTYAHYWAAQYCHDSYYTTTYDAARPDYYAPYYWANPDTGYVVWWPVYCQGPSVESDFYSSYNYISNDDKFTAELRLSSQGDTIDWIVGAYYEESKDSWKAPFATPTTGGRAGVGEGNIYQDSMSLNFWEWYYSNYYGAPVTYPDTTSHWHSESRTDWNQKAIFGEVAWHINDELNLTLGGRYFERGNTNFYYVNHPGGLDFAGEPDNSVTKTRRQRLRNDGRPFGRTGEEDAFIPKVSLSYSFADDKMLYGLYSRGLRQGGVNRSRGAPFFPNDYSTDIMDNYEIGFKSSFGDGRGRFNLTVYNMIWQDYQLNLVDPASQPCEDGNGNELPSVSIDHECGQPWQAIIANAGEAHIAGINAELDYALSERWVLGINAEKMEAETDTEHDLTGDGESNLIAGLRLPLVPSWKSSAWLEYNVPTSFMGGEQFFVRTQWSYTGDSLNILEPLPKSDPNPQVSNPSYVIGDIRAGIVGEDWQVDLFVNNVTNERAQYTHQTGLFEWGAAQTDEGRAHHQTIFTNRPMEFGIRYMKRWGD